MKYVLSTIFKALSAVLFLIFLGGIIFKITHIDLKTKEPEISESVINDSEELLCNSEFAKNVIMEISDIEGVKSVSYFELDKKVLIGIETENKFNEEYILDLKNFAKNTVIRCNGTNLDDICVEINNENSNDISELAYYAGMGMTVNVLNSRFYDIYDELYDDF